MTLPLLGVALKRKDFDALAGWICEEGRTLELQDFMSWEMLGSDAAPVIESWRKALAPHSGLRGIHGPFVGLDVSSADPEVRAVVQKRCLQALEICETLGGTHMVVHSPFTHWHVQNRRCYPHIKPNMISAMADCLAPVLLRASETGCTVMLENCDDCDPRDPLDAIEAIAHPNLRASIDTGHADLVHSQYGAPPVVDFIFAAAAHLGHVHLQDVDGHADRHWHPGDGRINWPPVFRALGAVESLPRLILEVRSNLHLLPETVARLEAQGLAR